MFLIDARRDGPSSVRDDAIMSKWERQKSCQIGWRTRTCPGVAATIQKGLDVAIVIGVKLNPSAFRLTGGLTLLRCLLSAVALNQMTWE